MTHANPEKTSEWGYLLVLEESLMGSTLRYLRSFQSADIALEAGKYAAWDNGIRFSAPIHVPLAVQNLLADPTQGPIVYGFLLNLVQTKRAETFLAPQVVQNLINEPAQGQIVYQFFLELAQTNPELHGVTQRLDYE